MELTNLGGIYFRKTSGGKLQSHALNVAWTLPKCVLGAGQPGPTRVPALSNTRCRSLNAVGAWGGVFVGTACACTRVCVAEKLCFFVHVRVCMRFHRNVVVRLLWVSSSPRTWPLAHCLHCCHVSSSQTGHMKPDISVHPHCAPPLYFLLFLFSSCKHNDALIKI